MFLIWRHVMLCHDVSCHPTWLTGWTEPSFFLSPPLSLSLIFPPLLSALLPLAFLPSFRPTFLTHPYFSTHHLPINLDSTTTTAAIFSSLPLSHITSTAVVAVTSQGKGGRHSECHSILSFLPSPSAHNKHYTTVHNHLNDLLSSFKLFPVTQRQVKSAFMSTLPTEPLTPVGSDTTSKFDTLPSLYYYHTAPHYICTSTW